jgi:hypothetical protein
LSLLAGCSDPGDTAPGDGDAGDRAGSAAAGTSDSSAPSEGSGGSDGGGGKASGDAAAGDRGGGGGGNGGGSQGSGGSQGGGSTSPFATGQSVVVDDTADAFGEEPPAYAEIVRASITGKGDVAEIVLEVEGDIPDEVGEHDNFIGGIGIEYEGKMGGISLVVQGTGDGWVSGLERGDEGRELEDEWRIDGNRFVWVLPWSDLGGPRSFRWGTSVRWYQFNTTDTTQADQAGDAAPDEPATYPSNG